MRIGSLCTGYGGLDLAAEAYFKAETIWCAEFDKYASQVIEQRFGIPNHGDIKTIDWASLPQIDILTAGYPCQPFSHAGQRKGTDDPRHIWPHIAQAISILRPRYIVLENVRGHLTLGFKEVLKDLAELGFNARWGLIRASDAGAPHKRERLFIVAHSDSYAHPKSQRANRSIYDEASQIIDWSDRDECGSCGSYDCNTNNKYQSHNGQMSKLGRRFASRCEMSLQTAPNTLVDGKLNARFVEYMMGLPNGWITDIDLSNAQQLKMLGNGVVPQQAYLALQLLVGNND